MNTKNDDPNGQHDDRGSNLKCIVGAIILFALSGIIFFQIFTHNDKGSPLLASPENSVAAAADVAGDIEQPVATGDCVPLVSGDEVLYKDMQSGSAEMSLYDSFYRGLKTYADSGFAEGRTFPFLDNGAQAVDMWSVLQQTVADNPLYSIVLSHIGSISYDPAEYCFIFDENGDYSDWAQKVSVVNETVDTIYEDAISKTYNSQEFVKYTYDYLSDTVDYPEGDVVKAHENDIYGALIEGKSKCLGMSCAFKAVLDKADISNVIVYGTIKDNGGAHAWNAIKYSDGWRFFDLTTGSDASNKTGFMGGFIGCLSPSALSERYMMTMEKAKENYDFEFLFE